MGADNSPRKNFFTFEKITLEDRKWKKPSDCIS